MHGKACGNKSSNRVPANAGGSFKEVGAIMAIGAVEASVVVV